MSIVKKAYTFIEMSRNEKILFFKAYFISGYVRFVTVFFPMRYWYAHFLGEPMPKLQSSFIRPDKFKLNKLGMVRKAVHLASRYTPWKFNCLVRVVTTNILLRKWKLGQVAKLETELDSSGFVKVHARAIALIENTCMFSLNQGHWSYETQR